MSGAIIAGIGTVVSAGTSIYGAVAGSGGDSGGNQQAYLAALADYDRRLKAWKDFWADRIPRMTANQLKLYKQTSRLLDDYKVRFRNAFKEGSMERVYQKFVGEVNTLSKSIYNEIKGDIRSLSRGERDPKFRNRVTQAEHEINRISADSLNDYVQRDARERAKGGMGFINPERRDEMVAGNWARSRDMARGQARSQVEATLSALLGHKQTAGQNLITNKTGLIDDYAGLAAAQRARKMGSLQSAFGFDTQQLRADATNRGYLDDLLMQQYLDRPQMQLPHLQQPQGPNTGQQVANIGGATNTAVKNLTDWYSKYYGNAAKWGNSGGGQMTDPSLNSLLSSLGWSLS